MKQPRSTGLDNISRRLLGDLKRPLTCSPGRTRTSNPSVNSRTLCQLSYRGPPGPRERWRRSRDDSSVLASPHPTRGTKDSRDPPEGDPTYRGSGAHASVRVRQDGTDRT